MSARLAPCATSSSRNSTLILVPLIQGLPPRILGSDAMRSNMVMGLLRQSYLRATPPRASAPIACWERRHLAGHLIKNEVRSRQDAGAPSRQPLHRHPLLRNVLQHRLPPLFL